MVKDVYLAPFRKAIKKQQSFVNRSKYLHKNCNEHDCQNNFNFFIQFLYTITQGKHRAMLYISKGFKTEQKQYEYKHKLNNNIKK